MANLETLQAIATLSFLSDYIKDCINKFSTFSVMSFSPVVTSTSLSENEVIWSK
jgi:hypothetical protein